MFYGLITDENNANVTKMLFEAMHEMALSQGDAIEHPVSLSLFLLGMGVDDPTVEDKLVKKAVEMYFSSEDPMKLTTEDFQKEFAKISPLITDRGSIKYILRWIGLYNFPKIYPVAISII
ncbi:hypothetical protein lacNasYZ03_01050 [Lactobacillus nasalidis]|uniref:TerB family tellurite resistance protein n=1 Tax=Lactobacillus nasalidis TaxID=2797258 RepID=A0ABQ3W3I1_9LACO|nr:hypothetical protein [Lactobacillus nasalidis]GHV96849.1 hypothetical protein lacNasYZ01_00310 [Lactobacillus nasalidis]GHV98639.1 hypothetical protein lacNasYZ02_00690 [Lactobacillus nasalidis]GHW00418.1 hypothetical protein lacNasYZ03_01050 [Lactobacillus nasalidis]